MSILDELDARGLCASCTDRAGLAELLASHAPVAVYAGYDPTSPSLHIGNLVPSILLKRLQLAGHRPIVVVGGATGMIGDPSGRSDERNLLDTATLEINVAGIRAQLARLLEFDTSPTGAALTNNYEWTVGVSYLDFLRDIGKYLTVNYMTAKDSVQSRLEGDAGHQLHRVLVHAAAGVRLRASRRVARLPAAGRRQRSVRQHHGGLRAATQARSRAAVRLDRTAAPRLDRPEDGQDVDRRADLARPGAHAAVRVLPVLAEHEPTTTPRASCGCSRSSRSRVSTS